MPTIKTFGRVKICMYFADHGEPHFHVLSPDGQLVVRIADLRILEGSRRRIAAKQALAWAAAHRKELMAIWQKMQRSVR